MLPPTAASIWVLGGSGLPPSPTEWCKEIVYMTPKGAAGRVDDAIEKQQPLELQEPLNPFSPLGSYKILRYPLRSVE
jgi:hypothetical protein